MANIIEYVDDLLEFGRSKRDNLSYKYLLGKTVKRGLKAEDYDALYAMGDNGARLLNRFLAEVRKLQYGSR
ncbi:MAG: hypothetical protein LBB08_03025 [Rickettsiales bacterium]|jgi:hypothetical protein|nr:hypothetical protein [Rickettsiales bacterium]